MRAADEMASQIYHIYSSGMCRSREPIKRVSSAGPVLCGTEVFFKEVPPEDVGTMEQDEYYDGCVRSEHREDIVRARDEDDADGEMRSLKDEVGNGTEMLGTCGDELEENDETGTSVNNEAPHRDAFVEQLDNELTGALGSSRSIPHEERSNDQVENTGSVENMPYLTIGADPEHQTAALGRNTAACGTRSRPIRRVLTWPPTAVQWKKQWVQNQHVLNVFPKLIFVTGYVPFQHSVCPATLAAGPQFTALEFLPENTLPGEDVGVVIDGDHWENLEPSNQKLLDFNVPSSGNISRRIDARNISTGETWRSGFESQNSPVDESDARSQLSLHPSSGGSDSGGKFNVTGDVKNAQSVKKKRRQVHQDLRKQFSTGRSQKNEKKPKCENSRRLDGGSPKDAGVENEHASVGLLHEVVENHGRWTRARWRQTQINKHKLKQQRQAPDVESR